MEPMRILISPAKNMAKDVDTLSWSALPQFLPEAEVIQSVLQKLSPQQAQRLWRCNDAIAALNLGRLLDMDLRTRLTPAILAYKGIQYQYMAPGVFEKEQFTYVEEHLRILSGFYGLLRPFDGVTPHRLEMQAKLSVNGCKDLYAYWGDKLARQLCAETDVVLNLASKEYGKAVTPHLPKGVRIVSCAFGEEKDGKVVEKGTLCKMARGEMVRYLARRGLTDPEAIKAFDALGYAYAKKYSTGDHFVFLRADHKP